MAVDQAAVLEALRRGLIDEDEARLHLEMSHGAPNKAEGTPEGAIKAAGTGVANAVTGFAGLPSTIQSFMNKVMGVQPEANTRFPSQDQIKDAVGGVTGGSLYKAQTVPEQYIQSGAEGATSFVNPFSPKGLGPVIGGLTGLMGEAGEQSKVGRLPAELATLLAASPLALKGSQTSKAAGKWLKGMGKSESDIVAANQAKVSDSLGVDALLSQGSNRGGVLSDITDLAKSLPEGSKITDLLNAQRTAGVDKVKEMAAAMSSRGFNQENANDIVRTASKAMASPKGESLDSFLNRWTGEAPEQMFTKGMRKKGSATFEQLTGSLDRMSAGDIRSVADTLAAEPRMFPNLAKKWFVDGYESTLGKEAGRDTARPLNDIPANLRGSPGTTKAERFNTIIEETAKSNGLDPKVAKQAANDVMDSLEIVAREQGGSSAAGAIKEGAGGTWLATFLESVGINAPFHAVGRALERHNYEKVMLKFIDALTSPDGMQKMVQIAQFSPAAHRIKMIGRASMGLGVMNEEPIESRSHY